MSNPTITGDSSNLNISNADLIVSQDVYCNKVYNSNYVLNESDLDNTTATNYHGMTMHVHGNGSLYYAHGGQWRKLITDTSGGSVSGYTDPLNSVAYSGDGGNLSNVFTVLPTTSLTGSVSEGIYYPTLHQSGKIQRKDANLTWEPSSQKLTAGFFVGDGGLLSNISGGGGATPSLQQVTDQGSSTTGDITANAFFDSNGILVTGGGGGNSINTTPTEVVPSGGSFTLNMSNSSYATFTANIDQSIDTLTIQNHTAGSQGLLYLTSNSSENITINGKTSILGGIGIVVGFDDLVLENTHKAVISFTSDGSNVFTHAVKYPSGVISGLPTLQQITNSDNSTTNKVILQGGMVTGNVATTANVIDGVLDLNLGGLSYKTFVCETANNISNISVTGDITGTQGIVFVNATGDITVNGSTSGLAGANVNISFDDMEVSSGEKALLVFTSDGTDRYFNAVKYPSVATGSVSGGSTSSNLQAITDNGNVTSNTVIFTGGFVAGNNATELAAVSNILTIDMAGQSYTSFTCNTANNIEGFNISNDITGSQAVVFLTAADTITLNGYTSNISGSNVNMSYDDILLTSGEKAMIGVLSDGTHRYINAAKFPSASGGASSNLNISGTVTAGSFVGDGSGLTGISGGGGSSAQACFDAHPTSGQNVTYLTTIILNTERHNSDTSIFSLNTSTGVLTVNKTATYMINFTMSTGISSGTSNRSISKANLYINDSLEVYTSVYMYNRMNTREESTGSQTMITQLTAGDTVAIKCTRLSGTDTISSVHGGTGLRILEILS